MIDTHPKTRAILAWDYRAALWEFGDKNQAPSPPRKWGRGLW